MTENQRETLHRESLDVDEPTHCNALKDHEGIHAVRAASHVIRHHKPLMLQRAGLRILRGHIGLVDFLAERRGEGVFDPASLGLYPLPCHFPRKVCA
jgi:hypothetical protein